MTNQQTQLPKEKMICKYCNGTGIAMPIKERAKAVLEFYKRGLSLRQIAKQVGLSSASSVKFYVDKYLARDQGEGEKK